MMDSLLMSDGVVDYTAESSWSLAPDATTVSHPFVEET